MRRTLAVVGIAAALTALAPIGAASANTGCPITASDEVNQACAEVTGTVGPYVAPLFRTLCEKYRICFA